MARRLAMPLTLTGGRASTVEAGSDADVAQSVALALSTAPGERLWAPQVGLRSQRGASLLDEAAVREAVESAELGAGAQRVQVTVLAGPPHGRLRVDVGDLALEVSV